MRVHIQYKGKHPFSHAAIVAAEGFEQRGAEALPFDPCEVDSLTWDKGEPVVGGVEVTERILAKLGCSYRLPSYPESLRPFLHRKVEATTVREFRASFKEPLFLKPLYDTKEFTGFVCANAQDRRLQPVADDCAIITAEVVGFLSEYRVYVLNGKILNVCRYQGSVDHQPSIPSVRQMIATFSGAPLAYSLDVGVLSNGETALVEVNDALNLGNYGLAPSYHAKMIAARWYEVVGDPWAAREEAECEDSPRMINHA